MAIDYTFSLNSDESPDSLLQRLCDQLPLTRIVDSGPLKVVGSGMIVCALPQSALGRALDRETFGIETTALLCVRLDKFESAAAGMGLLLRMCEVLLVFTECDFVLYFNGETGLLRRKEGIVVAENRSWRDHSMKLTAATGIHIELQSLPSK